MISPAPNSLRKRSLQAPCRHQKKPRWNRDGEAQNFPRRSRNAGTVMPFLYGRHVPSQPTDTMGVTESSLNDSRMVRRASRSRGVRSRRYIVFFVVGLTLYVPRAAVNGVLTHVTFVRLVLAPPHRRTRRHSRDWRACRQSLSAQGLGGFRGDETARSAGGTSRSNRDDPRAGGRLQKRPAA